MTAIFLPSIAQLAPKEEGGVNLRNNMTCNIFDTYHIFDIIYLSRIRDCCTCAVGCTAPGEEGGVNVKYGI